MPNRQPIILAGVQPFVKPPRGSRVDLSHPLARKLVHCYLFNEGAGDPISAVTQAHRITRGTGVSWVATKFGPALHFPKTTAGRAVLTKGFTPSATAFSVELMVRVTTQAATGDFGYMIGSQSAAGNGLLYSNNTPNVGWDLDTSTGDLVDGGLAVLGTWYHVVASYLSSSSATLYENAIVVAGPSALSGAFTFPLGWLGSDGTNSTNTFGGDFAWLRIWDRALSASEVKQLYTAPWDMIITPQERVITFGVLGGATGSVTTTKTLTGTARITASTSKTLTSTARIQITSTQTRTATARIQITSSQTRSSTARITASTSRTLTSTARITATSSKTLTGTARITATASKTLTAVARITATTPKTLTSTARITATSSRTLTAISRIQKTTQRTLTATANISAAGSTTTTKTLSATARITASASRTLSSTARLQKTSSQTLAATARITRTSSATLTGRARITATALQTRSATARITATSQKTRTAVARITATTLRTLLATARIFDPNAALPAPVVGAASLLGAPTAGSASITGAPSAGAGALGASPTAGTATKG